MGKTFFPHFHQILKHRDFHLLWRWVYDFMVEQKLLTNQKKAVVSLSGGADSLLLTLILLQLSKLGLLKELRIVHFHHGTRSSQNEELQFVKEFSEFYDIPGEFIFLKMNLNDVDNFEMKARDLRYSHLNHFIEKGYGIYLGHHIDDSFEWSLMQQFKSSQSQNAIGIPVRNRGKMRPLMCLTGCQIRSLLKTFEIPYVNDPSNEDLKHERNYLRHQLIPIIKKQYPAYLKNYVSRQNQLIKKQQALWEKYTDDFGGVLLVNKVKGESFNQEQVLEEIYQLSESDRGVMRDQITKLELAYKNGKRGPLTFSGGVEVHIERKQLYLTNKSSRKALKILDLNIHKVLTEKGLQPAQIPEQAFKLNMKLMEKNSSIENFPFLIISCDKKIIKTLGPSLKKKDSLFPASSKFLLDQGIWFQRFNNASRYYEKLRNKPNTVSFQFIDAFRQ